ncbi:transcriptional regulator, ArsR family [Formosa sp. Hel3_A1_48]|nr:transcriptional regulator, ArsR family [Formosa sp. Hel3_A1_48]
MSIKKGKILIAEPSIIGDISFNRSIILLADHNNEGSIGFILNKPLDYCLGDLIPEIESNLPIYNGGPVQQDNLYFIHKVAELIPESIEISEGLFWSGNFEQVSKLVAEEKINENDIRFFLGYSGWEANQLNSELKGNTWILSENTHRNNIIKVVDTAFWKNKMLALGGEYSIWSNAPEHPSHN